MDVSSSDSSAVRPFLPETTGYAVDSRSAATNGDSVAHKIHRERVLLLGWGRAILLQLAHPLVACAIADHSSYHTQRLRRLRRTLHVMLGLTFGGPQQIERVSHAINAVHRRVQGKLRESAGIFPAGTQCSAQDPALLCWVHATSLDSFLCAYELYVGPLSDEEKDRYCAEARAGGPLLGIDQRFLPNNLGELRAYMDRMLDSGEIRVTDTARSLAREILLPAAWRLGWPLVWLMQLPTIGLLPSAIREAYGFPWDNRHQAALHLSAGFVRGLLPVTPSALRYWRQART